MDPTNSIWEGRTSSHGTTYAEAAVSECGTCVAYFKRRWTNVTNVKKLNSRPAQKWSGPPGTLPILPITHPGPAHTHTHTQILFSELGQRKLASVSEHHLGDVTWLRRKDWQLRLSSQNIFPFGLTCLLMGLQCISTFSHTLHTETNRHTLLRHVLDRKISRFWYSAATSLQSH